MNFNRNGFWFRRITGRLHTGEIWYKEQITTGLQHNYSTSTITTATSNRYRTGFVSYKRYNKVQSTVLDSLIESCRYKY